MTLQSTIFGGDEIQLVSAPRLAQILNVSDQTVYDWRDKGLKFIVRGGVQHYDVAEARAFMAANMSDIGKGGKRPGAGAKRRKVTEVARQLHTAAVLADVPANGTIEPQPAGASGGTPVSIGSVADLMRQGDTAGLTPSQAKGLKETYGAAALKLAIEQEMGVLIQAADIEDTWAMHMRVIRTQVEGIPLKAAQALRAQLKMDKPMFDRVVATLTACVEGTMKSIATDPLSSREGDEQSEDEVETHKDMQHASE